MVYIVLSANGRAYLKSIATEMGGVSRYFSKVSGSGVDSTLLNVAATARADNALASDRNDSNMSQRPQVPTMYWQVLVARNFVVL